MTAARTPSPTTAVPRPAPEPVEPGLLSQALEVAGRLAVLGGAHYL